MTVAGAANGAFTLDEALRQGHAAGGGQGAAPNAPAGRLSRRGRLAEAGCAGPPLDRLPERRDAEGRRARRPRGLRLGRAPEALHHARHGDRPGQDVERQRPRRHGRADRPHDRRDGNHDLSSALRPRADGGDRRTAARRADQSAEAPAARDASTAPTARRCANTAAGCRPAWYGPDDPERAIQREAARARDAVALFDGSSLGKIEVIGPDAAKLADFHSYNRLSNLKPGKIRYGFLLSESGIVFDDGVTLRLADDRFLVSCSSGHATRSSCGSSFGGRTGSIRAASSSTIRRRIGRR